MKTTVFCLLVVLCGGVTLSGCSSSSSVGPGAPMMTDSADDALLKVTVIEGVESSQAVTIITYSLARAGHVFLEIQNATGYHIATLVDEVKEAGTHEVEWDARNDGGDPVEAGIIYIHIVTDDIEVWGSAVLGRA